MELKRYFVEFSYNGLAFHGWQRQPNALSVRVIEDGLSKLLKKKTPIIGAEEQMQVCMQVNVCSFQCYN